MRLGVSVSRADPPRRRWLYFLVGVVIFSTILYSLVLNRGSPQNLVVNEEPLKGAFQEISAGSVVKKGRFREKDVVLPAPVESEDLPINLMTEPAPVKVSPSMDSVVNLTSEAFRYRQHGRFSILFNYVTPEAPRDHDRIVTYTTHGEFTFAKHLAFLAKRWAAPISMALYVPGTDFEMTIASIAHVRWCHPEVKRWISFHLVFEEGHFPSVRIPNAVEIARQMREAEAGIDCAKKPWEKAVTYRDSLKRKEIETKLIAKFSKDPDDATGSPQDPRLAVGSKTWLAMEEKTPPPLFYPINVIRNVAREAATTKFVLASDVELYPSANFARDFAMMIKETSGQFGEKVVFPMPIFEVKSDSPVPETKDQLLSMLRSNEAVPFHASVCPDCHRFPFREEWMAAGSLQPTGDPSAPKNSSSGMSVLGIASRTGAFRVWEPIYVGTNAEPPYDERLSWEGKKDKMTQMYALCVMGYRFATLNNAFLVHSPGIKVYRRIPWRDSVATKQSAYIRKAILPELVSLYGSSPNCTL